MRDFQLPGRSSVIATNAICATSHPLAAEAAVRMLRSGGNAMDAAICAAAILGIAEPQSTGIGGDCFALFKLPGSEEILALNGSGRAPAGLDVADLRRAGHDHIPREDARSVTIPGAVDAFCHLSEKWGRAGFDAILAPAIDMAERGIPVAARVAFDWNRSAGVLNPAGRSWFLNNGRIPKQGDIWRHSGMAEVLRRIARHGRRAFYEGEVAEDMVATLRNLGGNHTGEDFEETACEETRPLGRSYRSHELVEHPPNGQGATALLLARILDRFDLSGMDPFGAARTHVETEAARLAYDARNRFLSDAAYSDRIDHMLSEQTAEALAGAIRMDRALQLPDVRIDAIHKDTVLVCVVDADGMAVSLIYSIFSSFGSGIASGKFGILLQNRGSCFSLEPGHPNEAAGGKRPLHTIIPAMLRSSGRVIMPFGVMGGHFQASGHMRILSNLLDFDMDLQSALDGPRSFHENGKLLMERGYSDRTRQALLDLGHDVATPPSPLGGAQAIWIDHERGVLIGGSDPRKDGLALGY